MSAPFTTPPPRRALGMPGVHFAELSESGTCGKRLRVGKSGVPGPCGLKRDASVHVHYRCRRDGCNKKAWSVDMLIEHEEECRR